MKIRLTKPLPQIGRVVPAGVILDAPDSLKEKLVAEGKATWADNEVQDAGDAHPSPAPSGSTRKPRARKGVKNG